MVPKYHCRIKKEQKAAKAEESLKQQVAMAAKCSKKPQPETARVRNPIDAETAQASGIRSGVKGKQTNDSRKGNKKASHCNDEINVNQCTIRF